MTKLTMEQRRRICDEILDYRFKPESAKLAKDMTALAVRVYEHVFSKKQRELIDSLPKGWMAEEESISVTVGTRFHRLQLDRARRVPASQRRGCLIVLEARDPLGESIVAHFDAVTDSSKAREEARRNIRATLDSFSTVKALRDGWPEITSFIDKVTRTAPVPALPAPIIRDLNAAMKLPPKQKKAA